jgi:diguanylate cyclase (GGDEF)-like protein
MRLRNWIAVVVSVILLAAAGTIGFLVNRSALRAADAVHMADSTALGANNGTLAGRLQLLSVSALNSFAASRVFTLSAGNADDREALRAFAAKSSTFSYGALLTDLTGDVLTASRTTGLPAADDPGWTPLRNLLAAGQPGFSSIMTVNGVHLEAVAVPVTAGGTPVAILIGLNSVAETDLQNYTVTLKSDAYLTTIVDSTGTVAASGRPALLGTEVDPAIRAAIAKRPTQAFLHYTSPQGTKMIAIVIGDLPGGWAYVRSQTQSSYDGAVHRKSQTINLTLLAMLLIGVCGVALLGYRGVRQRRRAQQRFQERLAHEARHDALTGLPNRRRMQDVLGSTLRTGTVAVLFVDLDGFKPVNDAHGHEAGDELLRQVAQRLSACVREQDVLARVGGDEFVVLMPGVLTAEDAESMAARIRLSIEQPFPIDGHDVLIGASVGIHVGTSSDDPDEVLRAADHAMYTVKKSGGGRRRPATPAHPVRAGRHRAEA